ncbi:CXXC motif containing zinc binding protein isoform X1 [Anoplopoma fimbria]|uniref:CXXC motif containing zinc binding protein isoform X1 n=1 Tax=Anoplopoma fimbria TaxID=229290 RepID=UPI0023EDD3D1|nr:CXXC motif containing zinc binding protein isoform X1 [Anoplopoma fimbria]
MVKFGLQFKATLENVTNVRPLGDDFRWFLKLKCGNCGEIPDKWQYVTLEESVPLKGGRSSASMVQKCKLCARENSIDILGDTIKPYNVEDSESFKTMVQFECRGLEPIDFQPQVSLSKQMLDSLHKEPSPEHSFLKLTCKKKTGRTTMRKSRSRWEYMRSHTSSSSANVIKLKASQLGERTLQPNILRSFSCHQGCIRC